MRIIIVFILFLLFGVTEGKTQRLNDAKTQSKDSATLRLCDSVSFYESQIRKADSLYKNYLPQYNFDEVKAAMEFFDSFRQSKTTDNSQRTTDFVHRIFPNMRQKDLCTVSEPVEGTTFGASTSSATSFPRTVDCCPLSVDFQCAFAHYYHAVGLTEKDDIVGACEHYLIALEVMEEMMANDKGPMANGQRLKVKRKKSVDNNEDYEKIRFVALIYTRLGEIFLNESCCDLAIANYKKVLFYCESFNDTYFISQTLKYLGYSYQLSDNVDSALYFYNKSLRTSNDIDNKLDIDKCIAQIMYFNKDERDSAFMILRNNLNRITNEDVKYSYHCLLGNLYYNDKEYDSAICYLEETLDNNIITKKIAFTTTLSAIYDSLGNYEKKAYYDNFSANLLKNSINKEVNKSKIQVLYNNYNERKAENTRIKVKVRTRRITMISCLGAIITIMFIFIYIRYNYKKQNDKLKGDINDYAKENKRLIDDFKKSNDKKDKIIKQQKKEISEIKNQFNNATGFNLEAYYDSDICKKILSRKDSDFSCLKEDELALLLKSANLYLNNISVRLSEQFPTLNQNDIYTICLIILNVEKGKLPYLLNRDRKTIWDRLNKIKKLMNIDAKQDLFIHIRDNYLH